MEADTATVVVNSLAVIPWIVTPEVLAVCIPALFVSNYLGIKLLVAQALMLPFTGLYMARILRRRFTQ